MRHSHHTRHSEKVMEHNNKIVIVYYETTPVVRDGIPY